MLSVLQLAVVAIEYALAIAGLGYLCWLFLSGRGRALRDRPAALPRWNIAVSDFAVLGWFVLFFGFVGLALVRMVAGPIPAAQSDGRTLKLLLYGSFPHFGAIVTWLLIRAFGHRYRPALFGPHEPSTPTSVLPAVRGGALTFLVAMPLALGVGFVWERFLQAVGLPTEPQELVGLLAQAKSPALVAFVIALALVLAPVAEELVFRVGIFRFLRARAPGWVAYVVSAGLFAALHGNWFGSLPLFILGLVFAASYERTGRIAVPMLAHALFNLNTLLLVLSGVGG